MTEKEGLDDEEQKEEEPKPLGMISMMPEKEGLDGEEQKEEEPKPEPEPEKAPE